jgi:hypothetical protein
MTRHIAWYRDERELTGSHFHRLTSKVLEVLYMILGPYSDHLCATSSTRAERLVFTVQPQAKPGMRAY